MAKDIKQACQSCEQCQKTAKQSPSVAPMQTTPTFTEPNHRVALDVVGSLPITKRKNRFILTYIDLSTRYPDAYPLKITTSAAIADALTHIFSHRSLPLEVLTDNGTNFVSLFIEHVFKVMGIKHIKTFPYCPQTNGVLERFHHTLMQMVQKCTELQEDWDENLHIFVLPAEKHILLQLDTPRLKSLMENKLTVLLMFSEILGHPPTRRQGSGL